MFTANPALLMSGMILCFVLLLIRKPRILAMCPGIFGAMVFGAGIYAAINWSQITTTGQQFIATYLR